MAQVLRYPYDAITETTDYLQIDIQSATRTGLINRTPTFNTFNNKVGGIKSKEKQGSLVNEGTVLLPMPSNIQDGNSVRYADDSMNGIVAAAVEGTKGAMGIDLGNLPASFADAKGRVNTAIQSTGLSLDRAGELARKYLAAQAVNVFGANVTIDQILAREQGEIFNPNMELLFNGVTLRAFKFSFKMTPRSKKEAEQIRAIIRTFKQNMAPKTESSNVKVFLKTPNFFELRYRKGNDDHPYLHKFKQCALTDISVNYTGENIYATYNDGSPISYIMDLSFRELQPIYNEDYGTKYTTISGTNDYTLGVGF